MVLTLLLVCSLPLCEGLDRDDHQVDGKGDSGKVSIIYTVPVDIIREYNRTSDSGPPQ